MFSCPSGMNVSSSRVPPPKVTTTAFCPVRMAIARRGEKADNAVAAVAPVAVRRNSRRLHEMAFSTCLEDPRSRKHESSGNLLRLESLWVSKGSIFACRFQPETSALSPRFVLPGCPLDCLLLLPLPHLHVLSV